MAFVDGVNIGSSSLSARRRPGRIGMPCTVPARSYSAQADPARYPRTMHSSESISARRIKTARPAQSDGSAAPSAASMAAGSAASSAPGTTSASSSNQKQVMAVSTRPLCGIGSPMITSNALTRSEATMSRRSRPAS